MTIISRIASIALLIGIAVVTLCPINFRPETGHADLERAAAYLLFGIALGIGFPRRLQYSMAFVIGVAVVLEALQLIDPGRHGRLDDMLVKAVAGIIGILLPWLLMRGRRSDAQ
ncbi:MAG TPA: VanZ family protein [Pararhizobium sp.]|nr:VanZ family protein [Pararhizobium sp.]